MSSSEATTTGHRYWFDATITEGGKERTIVVPGDDHYQAALWAAGDVLGSSRFSLERSRLGPIHWYLIDKAGSTRASIRLDRKRTQETIDANG